MLWMQGGESTQFTQEDCSAPYAERVSASIAVLALYLWDWYCHWTCLALPHISVSSWRRSSPQSGPSGWTLEAYSTTSHYTRVVKTSRQHCRVWQCCHFITAACAKPGWLDLVLIYTMPMMSFSVSLSVSCFVFVILVMLSVVPGALFQHYVRHSDTVPGGQSCWNCPGQSLSF